MLLRCYTQQEDCYNSLPQTQTKKHNYSLKVLTYQKAFNEDTHWSKTQHMRAV